MSQSFTSSPSEWMEVDQSIFIKKFGKVWHQIHEQHLTPTRLRRENASVMEHFYKQSQPPPSAVFGSGTNWLHGRMT
jgi:hypothetical protein